MGASPLYHPQTNPRTARKLRKLRTHVLGPQLFTCTRARACMHARTIDRASALCPTFHGILIVDHILCVHCMNEGFKPP